MIRMTTQIIFGLALLFGAATLLPRGTSFLKTGRVPRGVLYCLLGALCGVLSVFSFLYAYTVYFDETP